MNTTGRKRKKRIAIVLAGGGARGAYEAGVLSWLFEHLYPQLASDFEFDIVSGTSVGAIHGAYLAATAHMRGAARGNLLIETWREMAIDKVLDINLLSLAGLPLRALGFNPRRKTRPGDELPDTLGGLVDMAPLERLVETRVPWADLRRNLDAGTPGALCIACTEVDTGQVAIFMDGAMGDTQPWDLDAHVNAVTTRITSRHVRASAAIPFLFPAVRVGQRFYLDGGLRINTPLSPALRLQADHVLVIALKCKPMAQTGISYTEPSAITQPAFLLGKVLNALLLDQLEQELRRLDMMNAIIEGAEQALGDQCIEPINRAIREKRGVEYRKVDHFVVRPSLDLGVLAAETYHRSPSQLGTSGMLSGLLARTALRGVPEGEADLFSYLYFDRTFTEPLIELGREDARRFEEPIRALLDD